MRISHNIYLQLITLEGVFQAWEEFVKGKRKKLDVISFERSLEDNLFTLYYDLKKKIYQHGEYKSFYVRDPKLRHIHKACVKDRIVHHLVTQVLEELYEPIFFAHSYSCRIGKGTHKAVQAFIKLARKASKNNTSTLFVLKCDIKKFFATVDHKILLDILNKKIQDSDFLWLLENIIDSFNSEFTLDPNTPKGMPIGNLTSQLFANIYLDPLDQHIKHKLKVKYYIRYADDFAIFAPSKLYLEELIPKIEDYLINNLALAFHPKKILIRDYYLGIDFLGYIIFPRFVLPRTKTKKRMFRKLYKKARAARSNQATMESLNQTLQSYLGYLIHANAYKLAQDLKNQILFWLTE